MLDAALSADGKWCGIAEDGTAGATLAFGDVVYLMPPLTIDEQQTTALTGAVVKVITEWSDGAGD